MALKLPDPHYQTLTRILKNYFKIEEVYFFGSRITGTSKRYSDVDVLINTGEKIPLTVLSSISEDFNDSDLPVTIDIVDWHRINKDFQKLIQEQAIKLEDL